MLRVTITANDSPINVQDPRPTNNHGEEQPSYTIEPNTSKSIASWGQGFTRILACRAIPSSACSGTGSTTGFSHL